MLRIGEIYRYAGEESPFRLLEISGETAYIIFIDHSKACQVPIPLSLKELEAEDKQGQLIQEIGGEQENRELTDYELEQAEKRWKAIGERWRDPQTRPLFLMKKTRSQLIGQIAADLEISEIQARILLTRFWTGGMSKKALLPEPKVSNRGEQQEGRRRGKKSSDISGITITEKERAYFEQAYTACILKGKTIREAYRWLLKKYYCKRKNTETKTTYTYINEEEIPTFNQFYYWLRKHRDKEAVARAKLGDREYENSLRLLKSTTQSQVLGIGELAELDGTEVPVELLSDDENGLPVGRPNLMLLVDVYSRMIMGFSLSFEAESWRSSSLAIINSAMDKADFARSYGLEINQADWPVQHLPRCILSDNGPFKSKNVRFFQTKYEIEIRNAPARKGSAKGNVERKNQSFAWAFAQKLPGAALKRKQEQGRGARDLTKEAALTLRDLTEAAILQIIQFNKNVISGYALEPEMIRQNKAATSLELWNWSIERHTSSLLYIGADKLEELRLTLLPRPTDNQDGTRTIRKDGIALNCFKYVAADEQTRNFMFNHLGSKVEVCYDPISVSHIYMLTESGYVPLKLSEQYKKYEKYSVGEAKAFQRREQTLNSAVQRQNLLEQMGLEEEHQKIARRALNRKKAAPSGKTDKKSSRREEIKKQQQQELAQRADSRESFTEKNVPEAVPAAPDHELPSGFMQSLQEIIQENIDKYGGSK